MSDCVLFNASKMPNDDWINNLSFCINWYVYINCCRECHLVYVIQPSRNLILTYFFIGRNAPTVKKCVFQERCHKRSDTFGMTEKRRHVPDARWWSTQSLATKMRIHIVSVVARRKLQLFAPSHTSLQLPLHQPADLFKTRLFLLKSWQNLSNIWQLLKMWSFLSPYAQLHSKVTWQLTVGFICQIQQTQK